MGNWWDDVEAEALKRGEDAKRLDADPAYQARMAIKRAEDHARGVRLGWWNEAGDPIPHDDEEDDDEECEE